MDRLSTSEIIDAGLTDWRKLSQRFHARFRAPDAAVGAAFVADAVAAAAAAGLGDHLEATVGPFAVDLRVATNLGPGGIWVRADDVTLARL
ncbi:MAG: 4a-hydroxytetrahydrobiopterin dehydratase, partial [Ornithinibacter sp.]